MTEIKPGSSSATPDQLDYGRKKTHYQTVKTAAGYDAVRWSTYSRQWSNKRKLQAIAKAIDTASSLKASIRTALDIPCGTGRIFSTLFSRSIRLTGADLSLEMMQVARKKSRGIQSLNGFIRCDAETLPFHDNQFDAVFSIRFLFHLPAEVRKRALNEMTRISRQWVIVDYRHKYTLKYRLKRLQGVLGLSTKPYQRVSRQDIAEDFLKAGLELVKIFPTFPLFSDKWVILARKIK